MTTVSTNRSTKSGAIKATIQTIIIIVSSLERNPQRLSIINWDTLREATAFFFSSHIQSLTARLQVGDFVKPMERLLSDRLQAKGAEQTNARIHRSVYWEFVLFLASVSKEKLNTGLQRNRYNPCTRVTQRHFLEKVDKDYRAALSRIPKELTHLIRPDDHPPSYPALCCRRIFGVLTMWSMLIIYYYFLFVDDDESIAYAR